MTKGMGKTRLAAIALLLGGTSSATLAAPGAIAQQPLFLGGTTPPNLMFVVDNSSSMRYEIMTDGLGRDGKLMPGPDDTDFIHFSIDYPDYDGECPDAGGGGWSGYRAVFQTSIYYGASCTVVAEEEWRARDHTVNQLYYDPTRRYEPWAGVDARGNPFPDMDIRSARIDPYDPDSPTINLLEESAVLTSDEDRDYYRTRQWREWCRDQGIPGDQCRGWRYYYYDADGNRRMRWVRDLPADGAIDSQTNFANWFTYHRSREYAAKYAYSQVISEISNARIGFTGLMKPGDFDDAAVAIDFATPAHKAHILQNMFEQRQIGSTPLRNTLYRVGDYFERGAPLSDRASGGFDGSSPILDLDQGGACQMNATILMTDGFYNGSLDVTIGNEDLGGPNDTLYDGGPFADGYTNTLADIAMRFFESDLAPTLPDRVRLTRTEQQSFLDAGLVPPEVMHQHMNTYTIAFGVKGTLDPFNTKTPADLSDSDPNDPAFAWPNPFGGTAQKIDDLWHAAYNGRGKFLSADNPHELVTAIGAAVNNFVSEVGSPSRVEFSSYYLDDASMVFTSRFLSNEWIGTLEARPINASLEVGSVSWDAAQLLDRNTNRQIITYDGEQGIAFRWRDLDGEAQGLLDDDPDLLDYLRGDRSQENDVDFRIRATLLGDIINSGPLYIGKPDFVFPSRAPFGTSGDHYADFRSANADRTPMVWVGANDGMLHGFNANTGEELLAYVPRALLANLPDLANPDYAHRYYVDGTPTHLDAYVDGQWRTILTGGFGAGGKGWYALDVTDPDRFSESNADEIVIWEFAEGDDLPPRAGPDSLSSIGYSFSQPQVIVTPASDGRGGNRWAVVTGNGYNSDSGVATLFVLFLDADLRDGRWDLYDDYVVLSTGVGTAADKNGLSSPLPVDSDGDWITDRVYAGDVMGNLWAFDLSDSNPRRWSVANEGDPLFIATNASGDRQPITARPAAARHPLVRNDATNSPSLLIFFGTGQYLTVDAPYDHTTQSFYAVWDRGVGNLDRNDLTAQQITTLRTTTADRGAVVDVRTTSDHEVPYRDSGASGRYGWYVDLDHEFANTGERVTSAAQVRDGVVYFDTFVPVADSCTPGVETWFMSLDYLNGGPPPRAVIDLNLDRRVSEEDYIFVTTTTTGGTTSEEAVPASGTRMEGGTPGGTTTFTSEGMGTPGEEAPRFRTRLGGITFTNGRISWKELRP